MDKIKEIVENFNEGNIGES